MKNLFNLDRETRFETLKAIKENRATLIDCFRTTYEGTPADTVKALIDRIGYTAAVATVAELVNSVGDWDGRIYDYVRAWAHSVKTAATRDEMETYHIYQPSEIHPAHINQIGQAMREYTPEETAEQTTETEETTTEQEENTMKKNVLYYEERGCFHNEMHYTGESDLQNFRICCKFIGKDGREIFAEFTGYDRKLMKINGKNYPGFTNRLNANLQYEDEHGTWGFTPAAPYMGIDTTKYSYTRADVLRYINAVSREQYTDIQPRLIVNVKEHYKNFTGAGLLIHYVRSMQELYNKHNQERFAQEYEALHMHGNTFLRIRGQVYEYAGIEEETHTEENTPDYNNYLVRFDRITDTERVKQILANSDTLIGTITA